MTNTLTKTRLLIFFRGSVSFGLLFYLVTFIEWGRLHTLLLKTHKVYLILAPVIFLTGFFFAAKRWQLILSHMNIFEKKINLYMYYLISTFYSIFLPGVIGGDVVRVGLCATRTNSKTKAIIASAFAERISGIIILFVVASLCIFILPDEIIMELGSPIINTLNITSLLFIFIFLIFVIIRWIIKNKTVHLSEKISLVRNLPMITILSIFLLSAFFQAADIFSSYLISQALHLNISLSVFFTIMPFVYICTILPVSLGGIGVREGTLVFFLSKIGILSSDAVALSFLIYINRIIVGAVGGTIHIFWKNTPQVTPVCANQ